MPESSKRQRVSPHQIEPVAIAELRPADSVQRNQNPPLQRRVRLRIGGFAMELVFVADASEGDQRRDGRARISFLERLFAPLGGILPLQRNARGVPKRAVTL